MFLQGPYFSAEVALGPQGINLVRTLKLSKQLRAFCTRQAAVKKAKFRFLESFRNSLLKKPTNVKIRCIKTSLIVAKYNKEICLPPQSKEMYSKGIQTC